MSRSRYTADGRDNHSSASTHLCLTTAARNRGKPSPPKFNSLKVIGYAVIGAFFFVTNFDFIPANVQGLSLSTYDTNQTSSAPSHRVDPQNCSVVLDDGEDGPDSTQNSSDVASGYKNGAISATYFANWAIYERKHFPWDVPVESVTHVLYAFANVKPESGEVYLTDSWADEQIHWEDKGDSWNDSGNNLYGCFNQFRQLKQKHRHLKLIISVGGWTYSANFAPATASAEKRQKFADSAVRIVENYGLDGLDIDWEYPNNDLEANHFVDVLRRARDGLNKLQHKKNDQTPYLLTIAAPCGANHYKHLHLKEMNRYLSFINLMAYDYAGPWDAISGHQANLQLSDLTVNQGNFSTVSAVEYYKSQSIPAANLVVGMPLYGRSFLDTQGIGKSYHGPGKGDWESGIYDYKNIPMKNVKFVEDLKVIGAYTYNPSNKELITFDSPKTVRQKVKYIKQQGLGGVMWWESSGDMKDADHALIPLAAKLLGKLDSSKNHLRYPDSKWDNLKKFKQPSETSSTHSGSTHQKRNSTCPIRSKHIIHHQHHHQELEKKSLPAHGIY